MSELYKEDVLILSYTFSFGLIIENFIESVLGRDIGTLSINGFNVHLDSSISRLARVRFVYS